MQKKIAEIIISGLILLLLSIEFSEIINFIYILPFVMPFIMFLASSEMELHNGGFKYIIPFIFGLLSDIAVFGNVFILCLAFPLFTYIIKYSVKRLMIPKAPVFFTICFLYAIYTYIMQSPLWVCATSLGYTFLIWKIFNYICSKTLQEKENG